MAENPSFQETQDDIADSEDVGESIMPRRQLEDTEMDITPMIDITFLLLIFFLVASKIDGAGDVSLPPAKYGVPVPSKNAVVLTIDAADPDSPPKVYKGNATAESEMIDSSDLKAMEDEIEAYVAEEMARDSQKQFVLIKAAETAKHRDVSRVARAVSRVEEVQQLHVAVLEVN
ncbi:MAG: ExbD/TolR family protein [Pirellulaceae bacterium]